MNLNEKSLNYKVVNLVESYKFRKSLSPSEFIKNLRFFENRLTLTATGHGGCNATVLNRRGLRL
jgi:hypothetical protein